MNPTNLSSTDVYKGSHAIAGVDVVRDQDSAFESNPEALMDPPTSKLAYENAKVVHWVVSFNWKMHFVRFFNCWNDFDYLWYEVPNFGKLNMGFGEALGLGNMRDISTFDSHVLLNRQTRQYPEKRELSSVDIKKFGKMDLVSYTSILDGASTITPPTLDKHKNFSTLRNVVAVHLNVMWELVRSFIIGYTNGPEYRVGCCLY
ncbi:Triacylglycerol lipase OBL1 [Linum perenne]